MPLIERLNNLFKQIQQAPIHTQLYGTGYASAFSAFALALLGAKQFALPAIVLFALALVFIAFGFAWWLTPYTRRVWESASGKVALTLVHIIVLLLATLLARQSIASATGLPPQDYELAVHVMAVVLYIPLWATIAAILLFLVGIVLLTIDTLRMAIPIPRSAASKERANHASGATALAILVVLLIQWIAPTHRTQDSFVRWLVYTTEYYTAVRYPGVRSGERVRLHENGIVSFAIPMDGDVEIRTRKLDSP